jgi:DNA transformation protein
VSQASARDLALEIAGRIDGLGQLQVSRFFGGAALVRDGIQFAFVIKGSLYLRVDDRSRPVFEASGSMPFSYAGRSKTVDVASYYEAPGHLFDDPVELGQWAAEAWRAALDARCHRPARRGRKSSSRR